MTQAAPARARLPASPTRFVGRERETAELIGLLRDCRLVTATGPGGVGKTRLAVEVARQVADQFPDGVYFVELSAVTDATGAAAVVAAVVAAALGVQQVPGRSTRETLTAVLAARCLLLVLDNCEHVLTPAAELCGDLLKAADDVRILATSREQLWVGGETRYRLSPLELPGSAEPAEIARSAAVALFADRARRADPEFTLTPESAPLAAHVVACLDGMPLAIELAAARVEALGLAGLADRIDDALRLLADAPFSAAGRHRSLAAGADWSYRLLSPPEQGTFRRLAAFPGPFTLEGAEAVAGPEAGPIVLRLVDCSLVPPPRPGPDQRMRYTLLQTLRAYGLARLGEAGEERETAAALAAFALSVAEHAAAGLEIRSRELQAVRCLDAEDATLGQAVSWTLEHDTESALRLAAALAPWWWLRGRLTEGYRCLATAAERSSPASTSWAAAQLWLGHLSQIPNPDGTLAHYAAAYESGDARVSADALVGRAVRNLNYGQLADAADDARRGLSLAREAGYREGEAEALTVLAYAAQNTDARASALGWALQAEETLGADIPDWRDRWCRNILALMLTEAGELDFARRICGDSLARSREVGDLANLTAQLMPLASLERLSGNQAAASAYLHEAASLSLRFGDHVTLYNCLDECGFLCAETGRWAEAVTLWAAHTAHEARNGFAPPLVADREGRMRAAVQALPADQAREAARRGTRMTLAAASEFVVLLTAPEKAAPRAIPQLTERERELITLVAQGRTNAEIAAALFISIRTVSSHLDRIRDKTGYRRRADLTRLALSESLV